MAIGTDIPTNPISEDRRVALLAEYAEVNNNFRLLTNIRFKLLAFLPIAPAAVLAFITASNSGVSSQAVEARTFALGLFGIVVTAGIAAYNARNDQIYLWHVDRAGTIERELGLPDGSFANRPNAWFEIGGGKTRWHIGHVSSVTVIYAASLTLWLLLCLLAIAQIAHGSHRLPMWWYAIAIVVATIMTAVGGAVIRKQKERRRDTFSDHADEAIRLVKRLKREGDIDTCDTWKKLVTACEHLAGRDRSETQRREEIELRIDFYGAHDEQELRRYMRPDSTGLTTEAQYVALIVDLPPSWLIAAPQRRPNTRSRPNTTCSCRNISRSVPSTGMPNWHRRPRDSSSDTTSTKVGSDHPKSALLLLCAWANKRRHWRRDARKG
jgi:hypothetical protein